MDLVSLGLGPDFWETLCAFHPGFALAVWNGISVRPSVRIIQGVFSSTALNQRVPGAFDSIITSYSVFTGCEISVDPTNAFAGNPQKAQSDFFQAWGASGLRVQLQARTKDNVDYDPIPVDTPLQMVPAIMRKAAGIWKLINPDNVKAEFTLAAVPAGGAGAVPFTVWLSFGFLTLGPGGEQYTCLDFLTARARLCAAIAAARPSGSGSPGASASS